MANFVTYRAQRREPISKSVGNDLVRSTMTLISAELMLVKGFASTISPNGLEMKLRPSFVTRSKGI